MRSVCGKPHLKALLTHWFEHANLQLDPGTFRQLQPSPDDTPQSPSEYGIVAQGRVLGELAVERDPRSTLWTGSRQSMEHILNALIGETEARSRGLPRSAPERWVGYPQDYAHR